MIEHDENEIELFEGDEARRLDRTFSNEARRDRKRFKDEKSEPESVDESTADAGPKRLPRSSAVPKAKPRIPREEFGMLVSRAMLGDVNARDTLITLTHGLGHKVLSINFDEETRLRAIMAVTEKLFSWGMLGGIALGLYFDLRRSGALVSFLTTALKNAAVDELRKKRTIRDALVEKSVPYESAAEGEDGEQTRSPALDTLQTWRGFKYRLGSDEAGMPVIPGADSLSPLRQLLAQEIFEHAASADLNAREWEVANLLASLEFKTEEIAARLKISPSRARAIIATVRKKIGAAIDAAN